MKKLDNICFDFCNYMAEHPLVWDAIGLGIMLTIITVIWVVWG